MKLVGGLVVGLCLGVAVLRDQAGGKVVATRRRWGKVEEVKKAKAAPDLVADAGERRNPMTAGLAGELIPSRRAEAGGELFAGSER